jgi:hypothetical protein
MFKYVALQHTMTTNPFGSSHFGWIQFSLQNGPQNLPYLEESLSLNRDKMSLTWIQYLPQNVVENHAGYFMWGRCGFGANFFTGSAYYLTQICELVVDEFLQCFWEGFGHNDETLLPLVYFKNRELFEPYWGDYDSCIANYACIRQSVSCIMQNMVAGSFNYDRELCHAVCLALLGSWSSGRVQLADAELRELGYYFMMSSVCST